MTRTLLVVLGVAGAVAIAFWVVLAFRGDHREVTRTDHELRRLVDDAFHEVRPAMGYAQYMGDSKKCRGVAVIKFAGSEQPWRMSVGWYDIDSQSITDVVDRQELMEAMEKYTVVERGAMSGARGGSGELPLLYVGLVSSTGEKAWLQIDHESCGVRRGWLEYTNALTGATTRRQPVEW